MTGDQLCQAGEAKVSIDVEHPNPAPAAGDRAEIGEGPPAIPRCDHERINSGLVRPIFDTGPLARLCTRRHHRAVALRLSTPPFQTLALDACLRWGLAHPVCRKDVNIVKPRKVEGVQ